MTKWLTCAAQAAVVVLMLAGPRAHALTPADQAEITQYKLTDSFVQKFLVISAEGHAHPDASTITDPKDMAKHMSSLDALTATITQTPAAVAALKRQGLSPREGVVGSIVIMRAAMADSMLADPKMSKYVDQSKLPSPANMAVYRAHKDEIMKAMKDDDGGKAKSAGDASAKDDE
jgi:hypothetical protein